MSVYKPGSFRYAKYDEQGVGVDDPNAPSVPRDGIPAATWADLLAMAPDDGTTATLDAAPIPGGIGYTKWVRTGGAWRLRGEQQLAVDFSLATGAANTTEQILKTYDLPAGFLMSLRYLPHHTWLHAEHHAHPGRAVWAA
jgi:hypothetical protein